MILVKMRPEELKDAVERNVPVIMAAGVVEYHGPHLPIGTDFLIANAVCEGLEKNCECVLAPPLPFGPTMSWAAGPDSFSHYPPGAERMPVGHGGRGETQLMMGVLPETVRMDTLNTLDKTPRWLEDATEADAAEGRRWIEFCVQGWVNELSRK